MFDLGKTLRELRMDNRFTQIQVAKRLNVSATTVGRWEANYKSPSTEHLIDLALLYNVSLNYLAGIKKEKVVVIERLTDSQQVIINTLVIEFNSVKKNCKELTQRQQQILSELINEFNK